MVRKTMKSYGEWDFKLYQVQKQYDAFSDFLVFTLVNVFYISLFLVF